MHLNGYNVCKTSNPYIVLVLVFIIIIIINVSLSFFVYGKRVIHFVCWSVCVWISAGPYWNISKAFVRGSIGRSWAKNELLANHSNINWRDVRRENVVNNVDMLGLRAPWQNGPYKKNRHIKQHKTCRTPRRNRYSEKKIFFGFSIYNFLNDFSKKL